MREIASVTTAVARGDLTKRITVDVDGEILQLKNTVNDMTSSLSIFAAEVTRCVRLNYVSGECEPFTLPCIIGLLVKSEPKANLAPKLMSKVLLVSGRI